MEGLRPVIDELETEVDDNMWPLPKYSEMLFIY
jgi:glutamine synthetase type III